MKGALELRRGMYPGAAEGIIYDIGDDQTGAQTTNEHGNDSNPRYHRNPER